MKHHVYYVLISNNSLYFVNYWNVIFVLSKNTIKFNFTNGKNNKLIFKLNME